MDSEKSASVLIKEFASQIGFDLCGICKSRFLAEYKIPFSRWVETGMNAGMDYLGHSIDKRLDPSSLVPDAKSVIVTGLNYYTEKLQGGEGVPVISRYAYGINYHTVIKSKLNKILSFIRTIYPEAKGKAFVDSSPLLEKAWGSEAGLGFQGKNSVLINNTIGSFFFLGVIITDVELEYDKPDPSDLCGTCKLCIEACPTGAINNNRTIDCNKCIAYLTLESKDQIPDDLVLKLEGRAFGCDRCQEVCPWNKDLKATTTPEFNLTDEVRNMTASDWKNLSRKDFKRLFKDSTIGRRSYCRFMDNIEAALQTKA